MLTDIQIRYAEPADVDAIVEMVHELAAHEGAPQLCRLTTNQLHEALFTEPPALYGHVATGRVRAGEQPVPVGFALWFRNFSTWEGLPGIYLEDLYVKPAARGGGLGRRLLATLAEICVARGYRRLEWWMLRGLDAARFYRSIGARPQQEWVPYRLAGDALHQLAATAGPAPTSGDPARPAHH